jgi:hypothetical protein
MKELPVIHHIPKGLLMVIMVAISAHAPYVTNINITRISRHAGVWIIEGTITVNPAIVPAELRYNHDPDGFLLWWEQNINNVLIENGKKNVFVRKLDLHWIETGEVDIIGFHVELVFGSGHSQKFGLSWEGGE